MEAAVTAADVVMAEAQQPEQAQAAPAGGATPSAAPPATPGAATPGAAPPAPPQPGGRVSPFTFQPAIVLGDLVNMARRAGAGRGGRALRARAALLAPTRSAPLRPPQTARARPRPPVAGGVRRRVRPL